jgi:hypothetical protein
VLTGSEEEVEAEAEAPPFHTKHVLSIPTNSRIHTGPRLGLLENVVGHSHPVATAQLARLYHPEAPRHESRPQQSPQLLPADSLLQPAAPKGFSALQQLRGVCDSRCECQTFFVIAPTLRVFPAPIQQRSPLLVYLCPVFNPIWRIRRGRDHRGHGARLRASRPVTVQGTRAHRNVSRLPWGTVH